jgi:Helix-turn-helix
MVTSNKTLEKQQEDQAFSDRLNELLDARQFALKGRGRQVELGKKYGLTQKAARKWVEGEGMPETIRMIQLARDFRCNFEWLALGTGPRDPDPSVYSPAAELIRRMETATPETRRLIELALMSETDLEQTALTPSLKNMVGFIKQQIREEQKVEQPRKT